VAHIPLRAIALALAPIVTFDDLDHVVDGGATAWAFERIAAGRCDGDCEEKILRRALEGYCRHDTLAMV